MAFFDYDFVDGYQVSRFVSDDDESLDGNENVSVMSSGENNAADGSGNQRLIEEIEEEDETISGITILSSVSSTNSNSGVLVLHPRSQESHPPRSLSEVFSRLSHPHLSIENALSISTTETEYISQLPNGSDASSCQLSFHPSSLANSVLSELSWRDVSDTESAVDSQNSGSHFSGRSVSTQTGALANFPSSRSGPWYATIKTDEQWEAFRHQALQLLTALGHDPEVSGRAPEEILGLLIQEEEDAFSDCPVRSRCNTIFSQAVAGVGEYAIIAASLVVASLGVHSLFQWRQFLSLKR